MFSALTKDKENLILKEKSLTNIYYIHFSVSSKLFKYIKNGKTTIFGLTLPVSHRQSWNSSITQSGIGVQSLEEAMYLLLGISLFLSSETRRVLHVKTNSSTRALPRLQWTILLSDLIFENTLPWELQGSISWDNKSLPNWHST